MDELEKIAMAKVLSGETDDLAVSTYLKIAGSKTALFAGDDETDENVFRLDNPDILTIHVEKEEALERAVAGDARRHRDGRGAGRRPEVLGTR